MRLADAMAPDGPFAAWYSGSSWNAWRTVAKATDGLPMPPEEATFFESIAGGRRPPQRPVRELWCVVGRGGGKDSVASGAAAIAAATFDPSILRPGERALVALFATDRDQARIIRRYISAFFERIPPFAAMVEHSHDDAIALRNAVDISVMTGSYRAIRGRPILLAVLDEVAFARDESSAMPDVELYRALLPGMRLPQSRLIGISSPYRKAGLLFRRYREHFGKDSDDVLVIQAPSHLMNPLLDTRERDRAMAEDPAAARAEWFAEFRDDLVSFVDPATIDRCVVNGRVELSPIPGLAYTAAVDPSGGSSDSMTFAIAHAEADHGVLDLVAEWRPPFSPEAVVQEIAAICRRFGITSVVGDAYAGQWPRERFAIHGIEYHLARMSRSDFYLTILPALNTPGRIELLDQPRLVSQLCALERRVGRSGRDAVDHPAGRHDDVANAAAIALVNAALLPRSSADGWLEWMRRQLVSAGIETDDARPSGPPFGYSFAEAKSESVNINVPKLIVQNGGPIIVNGAHYIARWHGDQASIDMRRCDAMTVLGTSSDCWRTANPDLARDLGVCMESIQ